MKIAITGHTRGIGKGLHDYFINLGHTVVGFSKSTNYDLTLDKKRQEIVSLVSDCDIFINNAYNNQIRMFNEIFAAWEKEENKTIVNIGSALKYKEYLIPNSDYTIEKFNLCRSTLKPIFSKNKKCVRLMCFNPGYVDTDMIRGEGYNNVKKMSVKDCVDVMGWAILLPQHIEIGELNFWITNT
jgi:NADP-dependent 3-hydroxy acid dehydrogenase YdfG